MAIFERSIDGVVPLGVASENEVDDIESGIMTKVVALREISCW